MLVRMDRAVKKYGAFELDCSLEIKKGSVTGLIGRNGSGKTTAFKAILGLINTEGGEVSVFGKAPGELTPEDKRRIGVTMAGSGFSAYISPKSIAGIQEKLYPGFDKNAFLDKCREFGLTIDKPVKDFSTGMRAKFKLLCAVSHGADLLILDEPTQGLDVVARDEMLDMLREYMESGERSILISSHISSDLESLCDDVYMIDNGSVILHEDTDTLLGCYGIVKASEEQYGQIDKSRLLRVKKEPFGLSCLTNDRRFYMDNYPGLVVDKAGIDSVITEMIRGEKL